MGLRFTTLSLPCFDRGLNDKGDPDRVPVYLYQWSLSRENFLIAFGVVKFFVLCYK
jgi:hypothetical protein